MSKQGLKPGTPAPKSGLYGLRGPRGGQTGEQAVSTKNHPLPPTEKRGQTWVLDEAAHHTGGK